MATGLKELKIPKYTKGTSYDDYVIKLMSAASTRGKMKEVLEGKYMNLMPGYTERNGVRVRDAMDADQQAMSDENDRALAELVLAMPGGRLTRIVSKSVSDAFPGGCAYTALQNLKKKIGKVSPGNEALLKEAFESSETLKKNINPSKYVDKLMDIRMNLMASTTM